MEMPKADIPEFVPFNTNDRIVASAEHVEERIITVPSYSSPVISRGGTLLLSEEGTPKATVSFLAYVRKPAAYESLRPVIFGRNGGPSAPTSTGNALVFGSPFNVIHDIDGRIDPEQPIRLGTSNTLFDHADLVNIDPAGTGIGEILDNDNPDWAYDAQTEADIFAAAIKWWRRTYGERTTGIVASSFGVYAAVGAAINLEESGIPIAGLGLIGAAYEEAQRDFSNPDNLRPFATWLPVMALAAQYHAPEWSWLRRWSPDDLYKEVAAFARKEYMPVIYKQNSDPNPKKYAELIERMSRYLGLPLSVIRLQNARITPDFFRKALLPGKVLSVMDVRDAYDADDTYDVDPALDVWWKKYTEAIHGEADVGYPDSFRTQPFQQTIRVFDKYRFTGIWAKKRVSEAMATLFRLRPDLRILDISGMYDFIRPAPCSEQFWDDAKQRYSELSRLAIRQFGVMDEFRPVCREPGVEIYRLPIGHQFSRHDIGRQIGMGALTRFGYELSRKHLWKKPA